MYALITWLTTNTFQLTWPCAHGRAHASMLVQQTLRVMHGVFRVVKMSSRHAELTAAVAWFPTPQSPRQESKVCQPAQLITPPLSHSGQRVLAGDPRRMMGLWRSMRPHSNSENGVGTLSPHPLNFVPSCIARPMMVFFLHGTITALHLRHIRHRNVWALDRVLSRCRFFFCTLWAKCDFRIVHCLHRMFYSTGFVVPLGLHLCCTLPQ